MGVAGWCPLTWCTWRTSVHDVHAKPRTPWCRPRPPGQGRRMRALTWQGRRKVEVTEVPDPQIQEPTDAIIKVTSSAICGSDLHLYEVLGPYLRPGDVLGHEPMGVVQEVGADVTHI